MNSQAFGDTLIAECKRRLFDDSLPRLQKCLAHLTEEEIWFRPNAQTVSVGNLILHLCGNVRQWIVSALGEQPDKRERDKEFNEATPLSKDALVNRLQETLNEVETILDNIDPTTLLKVRNVQGFQETGIAILLHVVEHFSYHVGQITYFTKSQKAVDMLFYKGVDLNKKNL